METQPKIPLDVLGYIADVLAANTSTLKRLSLTCKFMIPICRRHIFSNITVRDCGLTLGERNRIEFLLSHPTITTHYIKHLWLIFGGRDTLCTVQYDLLQIICDTSSLTSVRIVSNSMVYDLLDWNEFPEKTRSVVLFLIQIPTLRRILLKKIENFPAAAVLSCCGLSQLSLLGISNLAPPIADDIMQSPEITALASSNCSVNDTRAISMHLIGQNIGLTALVIEFDRLTDASFTIGNQAEVPQICKLLKTTTCLKELRIIANVQVRLTGIGSSLATNLQSSLQFVGLGLGGFDEDGADDILHDLNHELGQLSKMNALEVLDVYMKILVGEYSEPSECYAEWAAAFDEIVSDIGAFPALREVGVYREFFDYNDYRHYVADLPDKLTEAHFPRLLESKAIHFYFT
ncbi:hypothetical protein HYPSUDRAFT_485845 [Hypholoma sublateritium FD-334 SS-4]|uniref:F-box domain-containing protein n=1 Tax=Hypholoma sublateritium (strain FD-334 SS-4) TaxID=945553 RepID=A0A0D2N3H8_HYPSF|nr:hypothetical protein HYPSUDRAFT_485845 [Hypholoma sublateritium FD-334 SS-4]